MANQTVTATVNYDDASISGLLDGEQSVSSTDRRGMYFSCNATTGVITLAARGANTAGFKPPWHRYCGF